MFPIRHPLVLACDADWFGLGLLLPAARSSGAQGLPAAVVARPETTSDVEPWHTYNRVLQTLETRYYGELPSELKLTYGALRGLLKPLDDPFTRFMDPAEYKSQHDETVGDFVGI